MLTPERVAQLVASFNGKCIIVLGDIMLDEFVWGRVRRISPEAPVPVVEVIDETYRLGGSANVVSNIRALGGRPVPIGIVGRDGAAERVFTLLQQDDIATYGLLRDDRPTTLKTRILAHNQQIARTDRESRAPLSPAANQVLGNTLLQVLDVAEAIVVSDYDKGVVNRELLTAVLPRAQQAGIPVFLDPKVHHADYYRPVTAITPNQHEAEFLSGIAIHDPVSLEAAGRKLLDRFGCPYVLITRGEEGMSLFTEKGSHHLPTFAREVFDVTGAGDTVIAMLALASSGGATMLEAATLANHAAGIAVGKIGTATVTPAELFADLDGRNARSAG